MIGFGIGLAVVFAISVWLFIGMSKMGGLRLVVRGTGLYALVVLATFAEAAAVLLVVRALSAA